MTCNKSPVQLRPGGKPSLCGEDHQPLTWNIYYWYIRGLVPSLFGFAWFGQRSRASIHDSSLTGVWTPQCEHSMVPYREILKTLRAPRSSATTSHNVH
ncbi:hypothetical protein PoMZ_12939 [Pyricularia oryzae]|uniref:Uncharacterized protein n=1 Tax=Pyricularia oryzae TaxID=318829 RepID=A0A4P7NUA3_PYROR|nr:hypothetical protein PoMZ_12939 [Pyricularia oryzae]